MVGYNPSDFLFDSIFVFRRDVPSFMRQEKSTSLRKSNNFFILQSQTLWSTLFRSWFGSGFFYGKSKVNTTWSTYTKLIATWRIAHSGLVEGFVDTKDCQEPCSHGRRISWFRLRSSRQWVFSAFLHQPNIIVPTKCMVFFRIHSRSDRQYLHNLDGVVPKRNVFYNQLVHCKLGI